jgi:hypothetical protein
MVNAVRLTPRDRLPQYGYGFILLAGGRLCRSSGRVKTMYKILAIIGGALALSACSSTPDWMNMDALKPAPMMDTVRFESEPPGAEAKTSNGQSCRTPCALALPVGAPMTVTFALNGYQSETENLEPITASGSPPQMRPNPVLVELVAAAPAPKKPVAKKPAKKPVAKKPAAKPTAAKPAPAPAAMTAGPAQPAAAPWPAAPAPQR